MNRRAARLLLFAALLALYLLHNDLWLWSDARLVVGIPIGLAYHVAYCVAAAVLMALLTRFAWPRQGVEAPAASPPREGRT